MKRIALSLVLLTSFAKADSLAEYMDKCMCAYLENIAQNVELKKEETKSELLACYNHEMTVNAIAATCNEEQVKCLEECINCGALDKLQELWSHVGNQVGDRIKELMVKNEEISSDQELTLDMSLIRTVTRK